MGFYQAEKPMIPKEAVWPAIMIVASTDPVKTHPLAQNTAKAPPHPFVYDRKGPFAAMLEVLEPALQRAVDLHDDHGQALPVAALGFGTDSILELAHTFLTRPSSAPREVVSKKIESFFGMHHIHQPGLFRVQGKPACCDQLTNEVKSPAGFGLTATQDHEIVRISNHLKSSSRHGHIYRVQVEIGEQGTNHGSLRASFLRSPQRQVFQNILFQEGLYQLPSHVRLRCSSRCRPEAVCEECCRSKL